MSRRSRNVSPAKSRKSSVVSWSDSPREQSEANGEDAVMENGTETHQVEINKKIKANDKLLKILTNMPEEHRTLIYGDSFKSKKQPLDDENAALLAAKRQFLPLQSRIDKQKTICSKEIESKQKKRMEILQTWIEADQELEAANAEQIQAKHEKALLVAEQTAENAKTVNQDSHVRIHFWSSCTTNRSLSVQIRSLDAKHGVPRCFRTAHGGWRD